MSINFLQMIRSTLLPALGCVVNVVDLLRLAVSGEQQ